MPAVSFHFHGYQPGDIVRWTEPDPLRPQSFEERRSPVVQRIGPDRVEGRNWTDAVLRAYGRIGSVLERAAGAASVDIEPQTLVWLLERDPTAYRATLDAYARGTAGLALTPPFHPILPHLHRLEREVLFDLMIDFYAPILARAGGVPVGLWLPEAAYARGVLDSYQESARRAEVERGALPEPLGSAHLFVDARQVIWPAGSDRSWIRVDANPRTRAIARDPSLSGDFAFGASAAAEFVASVRSRPAASTLVASDLESLLANPAQAERFEAIVASLRDGGIPVAFAVPPEAAATGKLAEFSSWSDYDDMVSGGLTSDTRWTGLRRSDGLVVSRLHRNRPISQLWKHAFTLASERIETAVRRAAFHVVRASGASRRTDVLRRLAVAYGRHVFQAHYRAQGFSAADLDFARAAEGIVGGSLDLDRVGFLARGYLLMLMGLRSDPRFWDNPDTRVTFQNAALLAQSLKDVAEACVRSRDPDRAAQLRRLLQVTLVDFSEGYGRGEFGDLQGAEGWETTEAAWHAAVQSEVPDRSPHDVVRRATWFALARAPEWPGAEPVRGGGGAVADTGQILGEAHGEWENAAWCEHRPA